MKNTSAKRVYIETTIVSYLTAKRSRDRIVAGHQRATHNWWNTRRASFELFVSQLVVSEASAGDPYYARGRLDILNRIQVLETTAIALDIAKELLAAGALPKKAADEALHVGVAASNAIPFLLTWNCRHLANAMIRPLIESVCSAKGFRAPIICTPIELMEPDL